MTQTNNTPAMTLVNRAFVDNLRQEYMFYNNELCYFYGDKTGRLVEQMKDLAYKVWVLIDICSDIRGRTAAINDHIKTLKACFTSLHRAYEEYIKGFQQ